SGNNVLNGGTGADRMEGGAGNDTYYVDNAGDVIVEAAGQGVDTVLSTIGYSLAGTNLENLTLLGSANINAVGNASANRLYGNSGNNILDGGAGADRMEGGAGDDTYYVDNAGDVVIEGLNGGTDTIHSTVSYSLSGIHVETLILEGTADIGATGNSLANTLTGNAGNNILNGL
ncbi:calcium-binding protein, partial [Salipiger aestuarii]|uniref:calcium-binding protein n=1 Tax=Salipiger aestuarii TaxID=568098 RepID=UPI001239F970